jgi:hypothetical protein
MSVDDLYKKLIKVFDNENEAITYARSDESKAYYTNLNPANTEEEEVPENELGV